MHAAVVIRDVIDCNVLLPADLTLEKPIPEGLVSIINPKDWAALAMAMSLKKQGVIEKLTVLNISSVEGEESLRWCLGSGADEALRVWDTAIDEADQLAKGKILAATLHRLGAELVLCGDGCLDQRNSLFPGIAAGIAEMTYATEIEKVEKVIEGKAVAIRRREKGKRERVAIALPALLAITQVASTTPERADLDSVLRAFTQDIPCWDLQELGLAEDVAGRRGSRMATLRMNTHQPPLTKPLTPDEGLSAEQRLRTVFSGGTARIQGEILTGEPEKLADKLSEFLGSDLGIRL